MALLFGDRTQDVIPLGGYQNKCKREVFVSKRIHFIVQNPQVSDFSEKYMLELLGHGALWSDLEEGLADIQDAVANEIFVFIKYCLSTSFFL